MAQPKHKTTKRAAKSRRRNPIVSPSMLSQVSSLFPMGKITPSIAKQIAHEYARVANPSPAAFKRLAQGIARRMGPKKKTRPRPLGKRAAARQRMVANSGRRRNPVDEASATYERFHGRPPEEIIEVTETIHEHSVLSGIGKMVSLAIDAIDGKTEVTLHNFKGALLAQDEKGKQLFITGGDQGVNVKDFGILGEPHELEVLGAAKKIGYDTRKDHLGKSGGAGERAIHVHPFGSLHSIGSSDLRKRYGSRLPMVIYDTRNKKLSFAGGGYDLPEVGIRG